MNMRRGFLPIVVFAVVAIAIIGVVAFVVWKDRAVSDVSPVANTSTSTASTSTTSSTIAGTNLVSASGVTCNPSHSFYDFYTAGTSSIMNPDGSGSRFDDFCVNSSTVSKRTCYARTEDIEASGPYGINERRGTCALGCMNGACLSAVQQNYTYPYPVSWNTGGTEYSITGASFSPMSSSNTKEYAFTITMKISNQTTRDVQCDGSGDLRMLINEQGDLVQPDYLKSPGCYLPAGTAHPDVEETFIVNSSVREFIFKSGEWSNVFFSATIENNGTIFMQNISTLRQG